MSSVVVVGLGAIGSHLVPHLARFSQVSQLTLIDRDQYDMNNLQGQDVDCREIRRSKVDVQTRRVKRINPRLHATGIRAAVEDVPLGVLRGSVVLACVDSRAARMVVNQAACRLGVPWIDAGIDAGGLLVRVRVYVPGDVASCLECAWEQEDYDAVEQTYPCAPAAAPVATAAPSMLGSLAASLQAIECRRLLLADGGVAMAGREVLVDAKHHRHYVTEYRRNPTCRMPDHEAWRISAFAASGDAPSLGDVLAVGSTLRGAATRLSFGVAGQRIATRLQCASCGFGQPAFVLERWIRAAPPSCPHCAGRLVRVGFGLQDLISTAEIPEDWRDRPLYELGMRGRDVFTLRTPEVDAHFELGAW